MLLAFLGPCHLVAILPAILLSTYYNIIMKIFYWKTFVGTYIQTYLIVIIIFYTATQCCNILRRYLLVSSNEFYQFLFLWSHFRRYGLNRVSPQNFQVNTVFAEMICWKLGMNLNLTLFVDKEKGTCLKLLAMVQHPPPKFPIQFV